LSVTSETKERKKGCIFFWQETLCQNADEGGRGIVETELNERERRRQHQVDFRSGSGPSQDEGGEKAERLALRSSSRQEEVSRSHERGLEHQVPML